ncbi:cyclin-dependent protein kinase inhibitor SMR5 [Raphanus sativus]|uniref:Cyclin-dependent protein kinase inhibitor SMR5 n=1 Tax=Raphanus sativus TaxID=3726 RepID=A0A9W3DDL6_RAPSA|nr:cyclin-dependent protein kinase inhibitor SMR5 [Raphanus sativus]
MDKGFSCYDGEKVVVDDDVYGVGCTTPTREECRIPAYPPCPPPLRRKRSIHFGKKTGPPKNGYFQPPDLELFFTAVAPSRRQESCA